jgi:hypothetical protein
MIEALVGVFNKYGLDYVFLVLLLLGGVKLFTNHLRHMKESIDVNAGNIEMIGKDIEYIKGVLDGQKNS